jgi:hypothetical protein
LVTSAASPGARHLIAPASGFAHRIYSSLLPYRVSDALQLVGAAAEGSSPGPKLADLAERDRGDMTFRILLSTLRGEWRPVATLELDERLPADEVENLQLDPANTGGGLELAGLLNRLRHPAYRGSQRGRRAPRRTQPDIELGAGPPPQQGDFAGAAQPD